MTDVDLEHPEQFMWWNSETQSNWRDGWLRHVLLIGDEAELAAGRAYVVRMVATADRDGYLGIHAPDLRFPSAVGRTASCGLRPRSAVCCWPTSRPLTIPTMPTRCWLRCERAMYVTIAGLADWWRVALRPRRIRGYGPRPDGDRRARPRWPTSRAMRGCVGTPHGCTAPTASRRSRSPTSSSVDCSIRRRSSSATVCTPSSTCGPWWLRQRSIPRTSTSPEGLEVYLARMRGCLTLAHGPIGDEWIAGRTADATSTGYELCSTQELADSLLRLLISTGDLHWADDARGSGPQRGPRCLAPRALSSRLPPDRQRVRLCRGTGSVRPRTGTRRATGIRPCIGRRPCAACRTPAGCSRPSYGERSCTRTGTFS